MRQIKIYTTVGASGAIDTNVTTLGQLKPLLMEKGINFNNMKLVVGETKAELSLDEAILPESNFKIYLMPSKTKSGVDFDQMEENIEELQNSTDDLHEKLERVLSKLDQILLNPTPAAVAVPVSAEDAEAIEELRRLSSGSDRWED